MGHVPKGVFVINHTLGFYVPMRSETRWRLAFSLVASHRSDTARNKIQSLKEEQLFLFLYQTRAVFSDSLFTVLVTKAVNQDFACLPHIYSPESVTFELIHVLY